MTTTKETIAELQDAAQKRIAALEAENAGLTRAVKELADALRKEGT